MSKVAVSLIAWTALGLFMSTQDMARKGLFRDTTPSWHYVISWLTGCYLWALLTPAVCWLGRVFRVGRRNWFWVVPLHIALAILTSLTQIAISSYLFVLFGILPALITGGFGQTFSILLVMAFHGGVTTYFLILGVQETYRYYQKYQEGEKAALRLQLSALKGQLQPHFLFNTLNAVTALVRQDRGEEAEETLAKLSDLLRCVLQDVDVQEVPLRRELEYLRLYLAIEQVRFGDRLDVSIEVDPSVMDAWVPSLALQPIVENALRHGIGKRSAAGRVEIRARRSGTHLQISVQDDGPGFSPQQQNESNGIGLRNTRARLTQLYGPNGTIQVENGAEFGALVTVRLPFQLAEERA